MIGLIQKEMEKRIIPGTIEIEQRADGSESRTISGYGVVFNQRSKLLGWFYETIDRNAFSGVDMSDVVATFNHNFDYVLARVDSNTLTLSVDEHGLKYLFDAPNTTAGNDLLENVRNGNVKGSSFMFTVEEDTWELKKGQPDERIINRVGLLVELGPVTMPAYPSTSVYEDAKRSLEAFKQKEVKPLEQEYQFLKIKRTR